MKATPNFDSEIAHLLTVSRIDVGARLARPERSNPRPKFRVIALASL
jgi:hypothetical protein